LVNTLRETKPAQQLKPYYFRVNKNHTQNPNPNSQKRRDRRRKGECTHLRETSGDLWPEGVNQVVEVGERVKLEREMGLVEHRQHPTCGTHQSRSHGWAKRNGIDQELNQLGLGLGFEYGT